MSNTQISSVMKYNFKGYVFLGCSCNGQGHSYSDLVPVELSDEDARIIQYQVRPDEDGDIVPNLKMFFPRLYKKINKEASLFATYATLHEGIANGLYEEYLPEGKSIVGFIQEDIDSGRYDAPDKDCPELCIKDWYEWEEKYLLTLSYTDRIQYIVDRYLTEEDAASIKEIDNEYSLELPDEMRK